MVLAVPLFSYLLDLYIAFSLHAAFVAFYWISSLLTLFLSSCVSVFLFGFFFYFLVMCSDRMQFKHLVCGIFLWTASISYTS